MSKPAKSALDQIKANHPDAVVESRTKNSLTANVGNGKHAIVSLMDDMHYEDNGWQEIDTTWNATTGAWQYEMTTAPYQASARDGFNVGEIVEYRTREGQWVRFQPLALNWRDSNNSQEQIAIPQAVATTVVEDKLSWPNAYGTGRHYEWVAHPTRLQKLLTVDTALPVPAAWLGTGIELELTFAFTYDSTVTAYVDGVAWNRSTRLTTGNAIEFRAGTTTLWHFTTPKAWDSSAEIQEVSGQLSFYKVGNTLHVAVRFPQSFIDSAVYPIYLDPTVTATVATSDDDWQATVQGGFSSVTRGLIGNDKGVNYSNSFRVALAIPQGSLIDVANLNVRSSASHTSSGVSLFVRVEDSDNAAVMTSNADYYARARTTGVAWAFDPSWSADTWYVTPSITDGVGQVIGRAGWVSGNYAQVFIEDDNGTNDGRRQIYHFEHGDGVSYAYLYVEYTEGDPLTLTPDGFVSASGIVDQAAGTTNLHLAIDEGIATTDNDTTYLVNSASADGHVWVELSNTPADFDVMNAISITIRARRE